MATDFKAILEREDALIAGVKPVVVDLIATDMQKIIGNFQQGRGLVGSPAGEGSLYFETLSAVWSQGISLGVDVFDEFDRKAVSNYKARQLLAFIRNYGLARVRQISTTTFRQIERLVQRGQRQGMTPAESAEAILEALPEISEMRAAAIAETELHSASQTALITRARDSTKVLTKRWQTMDDDRVRDFFGGSDYSHRAMQNTQIPLDASFRVPHRSGGFESLDHPGDPNGSPGNIINCRCWLDFEEK